MEESLDIVSSFPLPPKAFYEHLTVEEIKFQPPPPIKSTELNLFGQETKLQITDSHEIMLTAAIIDRLPTLKQELLGNFNNMLENIEHIQTDQGNMYTGIERPFEEIMSILKKLRTVEAAAGFIDMLKTDFSTIETFLKVPL